MNESRCKRRPSLEGIGHNVCYARRRDLRRTDATSQADASFLSECVAAVCGHHTVWPATQCGLRHGSLLEHGSDAWYAGGPHLECSGRTAMPYNLVNELYDDRWLLFNLSCRICDKRRGNPRASGNDRSAIHRACLDTTQPQHQRRQSAPSSLTDPSPFAHSSDSWVCRRSVPRERITVIVQERGNQDGQDS